jgi:hypothetical protein
MHLRLSPRSLTFLAGSVLMLTVASAVQSATIVTQTYSGPLPGAVSGTLPNQGSALELSLTLPAGDFAAYTTSYAAGGFQPSLTLFDSAGNYLTSSGAVPPPGATADPTTGLKLDALLTDSGLHAGTYTLALTDWQLQQSPTATNLSDGFGSNLGDGTSFVDAAGTTRTGNYALSFNVATTPVPEPAAVLLLVSGLAVFGVLNRNRLFVRNHPSRT